MFPMSSNKETGLYGAHREHGLRLDTVNREKDASQTKGPKPCLCFALVSRRLPGCPVEGSVWQQPAPIL